MTAKPRRLFCYAVSKRNTASGACQTAGPKRQSDLTQVILIVRGDFIEFIAQGAHAIDTMHPLQLAIPLVMHAGMIDDRVAHRLVDLPRDRKWRARVVESRRPGILVHDR